MTWVDVPGLVSDVQCVRLNAIAVSLCKPCVVFEIGSYKGRSTIAMASALSEGSRLITVDSYEDFLTEDKESFVQKYGNAKAEFFANIEACGVSKIVEHCSSIPDTIPDLDMAFIDGDHKYDAVKSDFLKIFPKVKVGGYIVMHDVISHEGPTRLWSEHIYEVTDIGVADNMAIGRKV